MKKRIAFALAVLMVLCLVLPSCNNDNGKPVPTAAVTEEPTAEPTPMPTVEPEPENIAKIILMIGQSNAVGATLYDALRNEVGKEKYREISKGYETVKHAWYCEAGGANGQNVGTNIKFNKTDVEIDKFFKNVKFGQSWTTSMFGPEVGMAEYLSTTFPEETFYIVKVAKGAVSINSSWLEDGFCYGKMVDAMNLTVDCLKRAGLEPRLIAICWMQGEDEGCSEASSLKYGEYQADLVERLRERYKDLGPSTGIPFIDAGISSNWKFYKNINQCKRDFAETSPLNYYFDTMEMGLTYNKEPKGGVDYAHFDSESVFLLGQKFAELAVKGYEESRNNIGG